MGMLLSATATAGLAWIAAPLTASLRGANPLESGSFLPSSFPRQAAIAAALLATRSLGEAIAALLSMLAENRVVADAQKQLHTHLLSLDLTAGLPRQGELVYRITSEAGQLSALVRSLLTGSLRNLFMVSALATVVVTLEPVVAAWGLLGLPAVGFLLRRAGRSARQSVGEVIDATRRLHTQATEDVGALVLIRTCHAEASRRASFRTAIAQLQRAIVRRSWVNAGVGLTMDLGAAALLVTLALWLEPSPHVVSVLAALLILIRPLRGLTVSATTWSTARTTLKRLESLLSLPTTQPAGKVGVDRRSAGEPAELIFDDVHVAYSGRDVVHGISFALTHGELVALVGPSGSGKSSLLLAAAGALRPRAGSVRLGETAVADLHPDDRAQCIGWLAPQPMLISGTLLENVSMGSAPDPERARACLLEAQAGDVLDRLGLTGTVEEGGRNLSSGQRQRVALARTLYGDPPVLLLDEPTASLDPEATQTLLGTLLGLRDAQRTILVATHRERLMEAADRVLHLEDGRLCIY